MTKFNKTDLLHTVANFCWFFGADFFVETPVGNFHWKSPDYEGDNTLTWFEGSYEDFCKYLKIEFGRDKGYHIITEYCGSEFTLVGVPEDRLV